MARTVINAGYVVPIDERDRAIENGVVAIEDDRIIYVGEASGFDAIGFAADKTVSAKDRAILPGLINTHIHLIGAYLKELP